MTLPDGYTFRTPTSSDKKAIYQFDLWTFPSKISLERFMEQPVPFDFNRSVMVCDSNQEIAGFHSSYEFKEFNVPGAAIPVSGLTWVGVHPQHRRKGILREMISRHFQDWVDRGESVSALFAAETGIYGRFGYGRASHDVRFTLGRGATQRELASPVGDEADLTVRIELFDRQVHESIIEGIHVQAGRDVNGTGLNRPGWATRETLQLRDSMHTILNENEDSENLRIIIVERAGVPVGYTRFRRSVRWQPTGPSGNVNAGEVVALDPAAHRKLWAVLSDFDLTSEVTAFMIPTDDALFQRLEDTRAVSMQHVDNVWTRIIDVPKALESRVYQSDVEVVLEVSDAMIPGNAGRWKLRASAFDGPSGSRTPIVERTEEPADLVLDIRELSAAYLGGVSLASIAAGGLLKAHSARALATASAAFGWPNAPMSSWVF